jgi:transposase
MTDEYWLDDRALAAIEPLLPKNRPGARRVDDRRVMSGILFVLRSDCRWKDCPAVYGPPTTIYNRWNRWSAQGLWTRLFKALADAGPAEVAMIDSSAVKAHRSAAGGKGGRQRRRAINSAHLANDAVRSGTLDLTCYTLEEK